MKKSILWHMLGVSIILLVVTAFVSCNGYSGGFLSDTNLVIESEIGVETQKSIKVVGQALIINNEITEEADWITFVAAQGGPQQTDIQVICTPFDLDSQTARGKVELSGPGGKSKQEIAYTVECKGIQGELNFQPVTLDFGNVDVSAANATLSTTFHNDSQVACNITAASALVVTGTGFTAIFTPPPPTFPLAIAPAGTVGIDVTFDPGTPCEEKQAIITISCEDERTATIQATANVQNCTTP
jgi:hypothetical protein